MFGFNNKYGQKKSYIVSKVPEESPMRTEINRCFEETDKYLKINPSMIVGRIIFKFCIGRLIKGPRTDEDLKIVPYSIVGSVSKFEEALTFKKNNQMSLKYSSKSQILPQIKKEEKKKPNFETVDENKLKNIYKDYMNIKNINKESVNEFLTKLPEEIQDRLLHQENNLDVHQLEEKKFNRLVKFLSKRTKKKEEDLLINKTDGRQIKREINEILESKIPLEERYGPHGWNMSLRRPKNFKGTRFAYINLGNNSNPLWQSIKETIPKSVEIVRKPNSYSVREYNNFSNERYLKENHIDHNKTLNTEHLKILNDLEIKGQDLLKFELDNTNIMQGKKILYKRDYLDSLTSNFTPNANVYLDYTKTNKNLTSSQVFAANYNIKDFYKEMSTLNLRK